MMSYYRHVVIVILVLTVSILFVFNCKDKPEEDRITDTKPGTEQGHHWSAPKKAAARANPVPAGRASLVRGRKLYSNFCSECHGTSGKGDGSRSRFLDTRPSNLSKMAKQHSDGDLAWKIANGRGEMPSWKKELSESQIWDIVNFIKNL